MHSANTLKRRNFIAASGTFTFATLAGAFRPAASRAAEPRNPAALDQVLGAMEAKGEKFLTVAPKEGRFLKMLVAATGAKRILEIGTAEGYGTLWLARGAMETGGHLTTIEIVAERVQKAKANIEKAGVADLVSFHDGDAHEVVPKLAGPFDFVFFDADKDGQIDYFNKLHPAKIAPGTLIMAHNAITRADKMQPYLEMIAKRRDFDAVTVSVGNDDAFSMACRHRA